MKVLIAPDSFKGSLSASKVAERIYNGVKSACPNASAVKLPLSDGGEGLLRCLINANGGNIFQEKVVGPLGTLTYAEWGILKDGKTAVIEIAAASGLLLVPENQRNPSITTTYGTGELIKAAMDKGCRDIILGLGGSSTNDGGIGIAQALGAKLLDKKNKQISYGGQALFDLHHIDLSCLDSRLNEVNLLAACDVDNCLTGPNGASYVYAPQKGADIIMTEKLDRALHHFATIIKNELDRDVIDMAKVGAAGGTGASIVALLGGVLTSGVELVLDLVQFENHIKNSSLVITGEGKVDSQSFNGKLPIGVSRMAKKFDIPVIVIAGNVDNDTYDFQDEGVTAFVSIINEPMSKEEAMIKAGDMIESTTKQLINIFTAASGNRDQ